MKKINGFNRSLGSSNFIRVVICIVRDSIQNYQVDCAFLTRKLPVLLSPIEVLKNYTSFRVI